jgi:Sugar (and other) transporter
LALEWYTPYTRIQLKSIQYALEIVFGVFISSVITRYTKLYTSRLSYQIPLAILMSMPALMFVLVWICPESPRWLIGRGKDDRARKELSRLRGSVYTSVEIAEEFAAMQAHHEVDVAAGNDKPKFMDLWKGIDRRRTILSLCIVAVHAGSGSQFLINYGISSILMK